MIRSTVPVFSGASLVLAVLTGCSLLETEVEVKPALAINGESLVGRAQQQYETGKLYLSQQRYAAAAQAFQAAAAAQRPSVELLNALAVTYDHLGRYDLSDQYYRQALNLDARNAQTLNNFAISLARRGMPERAALVLAEAIRSEPKNETVTANLAELNAASARRAAAPAEHVAAPVPAPEPPAFPRVERVGVGTMQLITEAPAPAKDVTTIPAPSPRQDVAVVETVARAPRAPVVQVELAAAPDAVRPVTVAAAPKAPVVVDAPSTVARAEVRNETAAIIVQARVEVSNGAGRTRMAARMRGYLSGRGVTVARVTNDSSFSNRTTVIFYRPGFEQAALELSKSLPVPVATAPAPKLATDVRVRLGRDLASFDVSLKEKADKHDA